MDKIKPKEISPEEQRLRDLIVEVVIDDLRKNGPIRMAMLGLFPEQGEEKKADA